MGLVLGNLKVSKQEPNADSLRREDLPLQWVLHEVFMHNRKGGRTFAQLLRKQDAPDHEKLTDCLYILRDAGMIQAISRSWYLR